MRFVPMFCVKEGMLLAKSIYNKNGSLLLREGTDIKRQYISKITELNIQGIYIDDDLSRDLEVENVINDQLRFKAVRKIKNMFINIEKDSPKAKKKLSSVSAMVGDMVDELVENKHIMVNMVDIKSFDEYTYHHSVNVCVLSIIIGISLGFNKVKLTNLGMAALLHDVGKVFIDKEVLNKVEPLTNEEFDTVKAHPLNGYKHMISNFDFPRLTNIGVLEHHERYDGTGYPQSKKGEDISLFARIIAITDVYDALTSNRYYRKASLPSEAMEYIMGGAGLHFDFDLVKIFVRKVALYPVGTCVLLSNGDKGIVAKNYPDAPTRPKIRLIDEESQAGKNYRYINLKNDLTKCNVTVVDIINI